MLTAKQRTFDFIEASNDNHQVEDEYLAAFNNYHAENPHVYELFKRFAFEAIQAGYEHYSSYCIINRIRWHSEVETRGDPFKINNNYTPRYARKFHDDFPEHAGFFRTRIIKGRF